MSTVTTPRLDTPHLGVPAEVPYYIPATASPTRPRRALKHGDTFVVVDSHGDIGASSGGPDGLFHADTRFLSHLELRLNDVQPLLLGSNVRDDNTLLAVDLTNPDLYAGEQIVLQKDIVHVARTIFLWRGTAYQRIACAITASSRSRSALSLRFDNDFADLFEVRGERRQRRGTTSRRLIADTHQVLLSYKGLDDAWRRTTLTFDPRPDELDRDRRDLSPRCSRRMNRVPIFLLISCREAVEDQPPPFLRGLLAAHRELRRETRDMASVETSNDLFNEVLCRSAADLGMLMTATPQGRYPYAGIPWYSTTFGRDGLITAIEMLWCDPAMARGVLRRLAAFQAKERRSRVGRGAGKNPARDARRRNGGARARFRSGSITAAWIRRRCSCCSPGSMSSAPATTRCCTSCGPRSRPRSPGSMDRAIADRDGFVEYYRKTEQGLANQGWKDSHDAIFHADGSPAQGPIALAEVQGYVFAAKQIAARCALRLGHADLANKLEARCPAARRALRAAFWCPEIETYALALDGAKRACAVRTSNAGQILFTGIARAGPRQAGRRRPAQPALLLRLGHPHRRARRSALQSDVLSQWLDLAARQCADRARLRPLRAQSRGRARCRKACSMPRPTWTCAGFRNSSAGSSASAGADRRSIRWPARRRPGRARRRSR